MAVTIQWHCMLCKDIVHKSWPIQKSVWKITWHLVDFVMKQATPVRLLFTMCTRKLTAESIL